MTLEKRAPYRSAMANHREPQPRQQRQPSRGVGNVTPVVVLRKWQMIPSMSRPANPYDNASCESFMKTLKREEIYANDYRDLKHLLGNIEQLTDILPINNDLLELRSTTNSIPCVPSACR
jgi:integrase-like protein